MTLALLAAAVLAQAQSAHIKAAQEAMSELRYPEAKELLVKARHQTGLTRDQLIEILWMQGLVSASLNQPDAARSAFRALFAIEPEYKPERDYPPKIMSPYYEARGWVATNQPLSPQPLPAVKENGRIRRIGIKVLGDPLSLVTGVRFHVAGQKVKEVDLKDLQATVEVDGDPVSWWAELIGERDSKLGRVGEPKSPIVEQATPPEERAAAEPRRSEGRDPEARRVEPRDQALDSDMPALHETHEEKPTWHPPRGAAFAAAGVGVAALAIGTVFGIRSNTEANALRARAHDETLTVTNFTQVEAISLELQQRREATTANAMFAVAGVAVLLAAVIFVWGLIP